MSPRFAASLFLLLGFPGAQPLPSGPPIPVPIIDQCGCLPDASGAPRDTCPTGSRLEFDWHAEPKAVIRWEYRLDTPFFPTAPFVSVPPHVHSVVYGVPTDTTQPLPGPKTFTLRAIGPRSVRETQCNFQYGFPPDTWLSGPDPSSPSLTTKPNGERYALLVNGRLAFPVVGSLLSDDSVNVMPSQREERRTFFEIWQDTVFARTDGDTVHMNSWVVLHSGGFDKDSPYRVHVTDAARQLPGFPGGPVLQPGPPNGSPVAFRSQFAIQLAASGPVAISAVSGLYPIFDPNDVFHNPRIGSYNTMIQSGRAYAYAFSVDGDGLPDRRIGIPTPIDPITLVQRVENGTATPYEQGLRTKVLSFYVDRAPWFLTDNPVFRPRLGETFTTSTWNLKLAAYDEDPYRFGSPPGGPSAFRTLRRRIQVHGHDLQGDDLTYIDPTDYFQEDVALTVPTNLAAGPCTIEVQLCDCEACEDLPGSGRCVSQSFPVTYAPVSPSTASSLAKGVVSPATTELLAPYPNPASHGAAIGFRLAKEARVELELFDLAGHRVRTIDSRVFTAGDHSVAWDGTDQAGRRIPAGLYVVRMRAGSLETRRKLFVAP
jgi:hypothetical protein